MPVNTWAHVAYVKQGSTYKLFVNGTNVATATGTATLSDLSHPWQIGCEENQSLPLRGYMSDFRLTKGVARYTKNFTPPTQALPVSDYVWVSGDKYDPYWNNVVLHMPMDDTVVDLKGHSITSNTTSMSSATKKFGTTAIALNGSQSVTIGARSDLGITGDFTFEGWVRFSTVGTSASDPYTPNNQYLFDFGVNGFAFAYTSYGYTGWRIWNGSNVTNSGMEAAPVANTWYHWAVCRSGSTLRIFINGTVVASTTYTNTIGNASTPITIGNYGGGGNYGVQGFIDDVRLTNGKARYTGSFVVPTEAHPAFGASN